MHTRSRLTSVVALAAALSMAFASVALADIVTNNVSSTPSGKILSVQAGSSAIVTYNVQNTNSNNSSDPQNSCNPADGTSLRVTPTGLPSGVTAPAATVTACADFTIAFSVASSVLAGDYAIGHTLSDTGTGTYQNSANFTLRVTVPVDATPPVISITTPADNAEYTQGQAVNASYACTDAQSAVTQCAGPVANGAAIDTSSLGAKTFEVSAASAGGSTSTTHNYTVVPPPDTTAPTGVSVTINGGDLWTNSPTVSLALSAADNVGIVKYRLAETQSGLASASDIAVSPATASFSATVSFTLSDSDSASKVVWMRAFDAAGNFADASDTIGLDRAKPVISGSTGSYVPGTWTNQSVTVSFSCADALSGVATDSVAGATLGTSGVDQEVTNTGSCTDNAGNVADAATVSNIDIDKDAPTNAVTGPSHGANYILGDVPTAGCTTTDALSGTATTATPSSVNNSTVGSKTVTCSGGTDNAGNSAQSVSVTYTVGYKFVGFERPVDNGGVLNKLKAGQAVPLKWRLLDANDNPITNLTTATVTAASLACSLGTSADLLEEVAPGSSGLQNLGDGYYQLNWKTPTSYANSCKTMNLNLGEGGPRTALFQFTK